MTDEKWENEGVMENLLGLGIDVAYYMDDTHGVYHYVLAAADVPGGTMEVRAERRLHWKGDPDERRILDGVQRQWSWAQLARAAGDEKEAFVFTYRGLRLLFPDLPEEP